MDLSRDELGWIANALNEVLNGPDSIPDSEFHTRMGATRDEAKALQRRVRDELTTAR
jgi:hypothetical protein